jgi:pyrroline-5-carboxylate reductase
MKKISFGIIGYGRMGSSLIKGALNSGLLSAENIKAYDIDGSRLEFAKREGLVAVGSLAEMADSDAILLAVKPKDMSNLLDELEVLVPVGKLLIISIVAGIKIASIEARLGEGSRIVRVMPNLAASVNEAASAFVPNSWVRESDIAFITSLLKGVGVAYQLKDEYMLDAVTGISGSGPAYFFLMMKALEDAGRRSGLPEDLVRSLVSQTCRGAGTLALRSTDSFDQLIRAVASPGGTTEEALKVMDSRGFSQILIDAVVAAIEKSRRMSHS